jgi:hypothetical protein
MCGCVCRGKRCVHPYFTGLRRIFPTWSGILGNGIARRRGLALEKGRGFAAGGGIVGEVHQPVSETLAFPYSILL